MTEGDVVQTLWSGYGSIVRYTLEGASVPSVILKHVHFPNEQRHPRGWNSDFSHHRKVRSYQVETTWYQQWSKRCSASCRVPRCLAVEIVEDDVLLLLEDLDAAGFSGRCSTVTEPELNACLQWLASFHATFMQQKPDGLWKKGTYWHLETRPEELEVLEDLRLKAAAPKIDSMLDQATFQTLVHGDAKVANFCFSHDMCRAAAVDFQYVGGGCGMKDVAYFLGSCFDEYVCETRETEFLDRYFLYLHRALNTSDSSIDSDAVEAEWRALYPVAGTDFYRFLQGWSPGHWKIHRYSERLANEVLNAIEQA